MPRYRRRSRRRSRRRRSRSRSRTSKSSKSSKSRSRSRGRRRKSQETDLQRVARRLGMTTKELVYARTLMQNNIEFGPKNKRRSRQIFQPDSCTHCMGIGNPMDPDNYDPEADGIKVGINGRCMRIGSKTAMLRCGKRGGLGKTVPCPIRTNKKGEACVKTRLKSKKCYKIGGERALALCGLRGMNLRQINDFRFGHRFVRSPRDTIIPFDLPPRPNMKKSFSNPSTPDIRTGAPAHYYTTGGERAYSPYLTQGLSSDIPDLDTAVSNVFAARDIAAARKARKVRVRRRRIPRRQSRRR